ncbi:MAG: hypothetical protein JNJ54_30990 [Myxococcaceae bacterium]|nr:hypothetical protein [Myxococcaceae bacterium]
MRVLSTLVVIASAAAFAQAVKPPSGGTWTMQVRVSPNKSAQGRYR